MFYYRTPGVVFPVCFCCISYIFRHPHAVVSGIAAGWRHFVMENNCQPLLNIFPLKQLHFSYSYAIICIQIIPAPIPGHKSILGGWHLFCTTLPRRSTLRTAQKGAASLRDSPLIVFSNGPCCRGRDRPK